MTDPNSIKQGRGAQMNPGSKFVSREFGRFSVDGVDEWEDEPRKTEYIEEFPKKILNKVDSPDLRMNWSMNPYQGCEHGCIYCYARNSHQYWGYGPGMDFEQKIIVKPDAPKLLKKALDHPKWSGETIMLSGNTDCYQPAERRLELTRQMLRICLEYKNPVGIITKNKLVLRDLDILQPMAAENLVAVSLSVTTLDEKLRLRLEPRTATGKNRIKAIETLSAHGIPCNVMIAPVIPGLNSHEIPAIMKAASDAGALSAGYTMVRLNGEIGAIFEDWIRKHFPDRADKVLNQIRSVHGGKLNDSRWGKRMRGDGEVATAIAELFKKSRQKHFAGRQMPELNHRAFQRPGSQLELF